MKTMRATRTLAKALFSLFISIAFTSCMLDDNPFRNDKSKESLKLEYGVVGSITPEKDSRADIPGTRVENTVRDIMVLFFLPESREGAADGRYVGYSTSGTTDNPANASGMSLVNMPAGFNVNDAYSLIILGNYTPYLRVGSLSTIDAYLKSLLSGKTQKEAGRLIQAYADAESGIKPSTGIFMSGTANKSSGTNAIYINFKRVVARIDVMNFESPANFRLATARVRNARKTVTVLPANGWGKPADYVNYDRNVITTATNQVSEALYAHENQTSTSQPNDNTTTCLIVGGYYNNSSRMSYYRMNILTVGASQNLQRNHLYTVNIQSVVGPGAATPDDAYNATEAVMKYDVDESNGYSNK